MHDVAIRLRELHDEDILTLATQIQNIYSNMQSDHSKLHVGL